MRFVVAWIAAMWLATAAWAQGAALRPDLRAEVPVYATVDAGPHVKCLVQSKDVVRAREALAEVPGVLRILETSPGDAARVVTEVVS